MPDLSEIHNASSPTAAPELRDALVLDDAGTADQLVRCTYAGEPNLATDPMPWNPVTTTVGEFWPKHGDRAILGFPPDGPPAVLAWWPAAAEPNVSF